jgi:hypothetical protein
MVHRFRLADVLSELDAEVRAIVAVDGLGFVIGEDRGDFSFLSRHRWGNSGYSFAIGDLPAPFALQQSAAAQYTPSSAAFDVSRPVDAMLARAGLEGLTIVPLPSGAGRFWTVTRSTERLTDRQLDAYTVLGESVGRRICAPDSVEQSLCRLRRLDLLEALVPALADALDVGEIFGRLAGIVGQILPHDSLELLLPTSDRKSARFHARAGSNTSSLPELVELPPHMALTDAWRYFIIDDFQAHPEEAQMSAAAAGFRSSLRVTIRLRDRSLGGLNVMSLDAHRYSAEDLFVALTLADRLALALSHADLPGDSRPSPA